MKSSLSTTLAIDLPTTLIFDYPTVAALTAFVLSRSSSIGTSATAKLTSPQLQHLTSAEASLSAHQAGAGGQRDILRTVQAAFLEILGTEIGPEQPFAAAGLDSLAAVEARNELGRSISPPLTCG